MNVERATLAALAGLPHLGPAGLRLLIHHHPPDEAWAVATGRHPSPVEATAEFVQRARARELWRHLDPELPALMAERCALLQVAVLVPDDPDYPPVLAQDPSAPAVLFSQGDPTALHRRRVGLVGTRHATATGRATAAELAHGLARHGVAVVSGLARGVDAAAHRAHLDASGVPIGVVASGHDVVYPREHAALWRDVANRGWLLSERPPGSRPEGYRFPLRNRILAVLSEVLVVVESRGTGGSLITADEAARRGRPVLAVPGSVRNPAAQGTNDLIADGAAPVRDLDDVLVALGLHRCEAPPATPPPLDGVDRRIDEALAQGACSLDDLIRLTGQPLSLVMRSLTRLEAAGVLDVTNGWFERGHAPWGRP